MIFPGRTVMGFKAFDGSERYFRRLGVYDLDCCLIMGRGSYSPDDGYYVVEKDESNCKNCNCTCSCTLCKVVDSARFYADNGYSVGTIRACPTISPITNPRNSATWVSLIKNEFCCNADGDKIYAELFDEIVDNPLP